jgi:hypothetical protein
VCTGIKFPSNWYAVFYCVLCYIFVTLILNVFCYVKEGDAFLITHKKPVRGELLLWLQDAPAAAHDWRSSTSPTQHVPA